MSQKQSHDINAPILVIVRRGRNGRGYAIAPVDAPSDIAVCADSVQVGEAIVELLDDEKQVRVDLDELLNAAQEDEKEIVKDEKGGEEEEEDEEEEEEEEEEPWYRAQDPADALLIHGLSKLLEKGRKISRPSGRRRKKKKK